ncbi:carbohydrate esterase family 1 protein [Apiospora saccharicola]
MQFKFALITALATLGNGQSPSQVRDFNAGPTRLGMWTYVPRTLSKPAPIVVAVHHCQGSAQGYSQETRYQPLADQHGFIIIYPNSKSGGGCFDVASTATLTHNGGGDSQTIANMVDYAVKNLGGDRNRTFVTGSSSGAMMTQVLAGAYPDVFKAASAYSGVPDGCFFVQGSTATQDPPAGTTSAPTARSPSRPRSGAMRWHGTADNTLRYPNYQESMKQWSNALGLTTSKTAQNNPQQGYTQTIYGDGTSTTAKLVGYSGAGGGPHGPGA